jgi:hypothetical protein
VVLKAELLVATAVNLLVVLVLLNFLEATAAA